MPINLKQLAKEVAEHDGILMTQILSLRREDAARLGFEKGEVWRDMLREQADELAKAMGIPIEDQRWYAAFHNEGHVLLKDGQVFYQLRRENDTDTQFYQRISHALTALTTGGDAQ